MMSGNPDLSRELAKAHQYSLQLERQLKQHLGMVNIIELPELVYGHMLSSICTYMYVCLCLWPTVMPIDSLSI